MKTTRLHAALLVTLALTAAAPSAQEDDPKVARRRSPIVEVVERARPAVVSIDCSVGLSRNIFGVPVSGTGVVLFEDGILVTNYHVVFPNDRLADSITIRFDQSDDDEVYQGEVISAEKSEDLALVKIQGPGPFPTVVMSDDEPILGETVIAIGNAVGLSHTVSTGIISGLHRDLPIVERGLYFKQLLQTDAAINSGNSGGPLLDINGELVGINTAVTRNAENIGYAIPVARVRSVLEEKLLHPSRARSYLGYEIDGQTLEVVEVLANGPADLAGLQVGERVRAINGRPVDDLEVYNLQRIAITPGETVQLRTDRGERTLASWKLVDGMIHRSLGLTLQPAFLGPWRERYLQVVSVDPAGPAGRIGLRPQDVIAAARPAGWRRAARLVRSEDLAMLLARMEPGATLDIEIFRDDDQDGRFERDGTVSELYKGKLKLR